MKPSKSQDVGNIEAGREFQSFLWINIEKKGIHVRQGSMLRRVSSSFHPIAETKRHWMLLVDKY